MRDYVDSVENILVNLSDVVKGKDKDDVLLFRGHVDKQYILKPSSERKNEKDWERKRYRELLCEYPNEFSRDHVSNLAKMQHYNSSTRLIDFTKNLLVAVFFACYADSKTEDNDNKDKDGEVIVVRERRDNILHHTSDKALMLACLPTLCDTDQESIKKFCEMNPQVISEELIKEQDAFKRFLHEIRRECPAFACEVVGKDLLNNYFIETYYDNHRIINQSGLFLIFGLGNDDFDKDKRIIRRITIPGSQKDYLLNELEILGISERTIYPEMSRQRYLLR